MLLLCIRVLPVRAFILQQHLIVSSPLLIYSPTPQIVSSEQTEREREKYEFITGNIFFIYYDYYSLGLRVNNATYKGWLISRPVKLDFAEDKTKPYHIREIEAI